MKNIITSIKAFIGFSILLGIVYPLAITGIAQIAMPQKANGSLIVQKGQIVGSSLIGQKFDKPEYFNSRPSAVNYNAAGSGASNLGPSSKKLMTQVQDRINGIKPLTPTLSPKGRGRSALTTHFSVPADMVLTSASGLDPHISVENANFQATRVAKLRGISEEKVQNLISQNTDHNFLGIWGQDGVNVLKLNIALDKEGK